MKGKLETEEPYSGCAIKQTKSLLKSSNSKKVAADYTKS